MAMCGYVARIMCRHTHYVSKVPDSREAFDKALADFYKEREAILAPPNIAHVPLDCFFIFRSVAERGGFEGASGTRCVFVHAMLAMCCFSKSSLAPPIGICNQNSHP